MPIGTVDYVSAAPWNDPYNPFPTANSLYLSAVNIAPAILTVFEFDPYALNTAGETVVKYRVADAFISITVNYVYLTSLGAHAWTVAPAFSLSFDYTLVTETRQVPTKLPGLSGSWIPRLGISTPEEIASLTIIPNFKDLTAWEYRRRRLLELC